ncbi:MAG: hypothetical protein ACFFA6_17605, partial [Promethearchaeota archaeon]
RGGGPPLYNLLDPPDRVVRDFYDALNVPDVDRLSECVDPDNPITPNVLQILQMLLGTNLNEWISEQLGRKIELAWRFQNLTFETVERTWDSAKVHVTGQVRVWDKETNVGLTIPFDWTHNVVKKNGRWYMKPY